jgi:hypothetical protein
MPSENCSRSPQKHNGQPRIKRELAAEMVQARSGLLVALCANLAFLFGSHAARVRAFFTLLGGLVTAASFFVLLISSDGSTDEGEGHGNGGKQRDDFHGSDDFGLLLVFPRMMPPHAKRPFLRIRRIIPITAFSSSAKNAS